MVSKLVFKFALNIHNLQLFKTDILDAIYYIIFKSLVYIVIYITMIMYIMK